MLQINDSSQGSRAMLFSQLSEAQLGRDYPHIEILCKITEFVLSCFIGECESSGPVM